jgi:hypothetical protein
LPHVSPRANDAPGDGKKAETAMWVLAIYVVLMIIGDALDIGIGAVVSHYWSDTASLPIFLAVYFATLVAAWYAAVAIAERMKLTT